MNRKYIITGIGLLTVTAVAIYFWRRRTSLIDELKAEQVAEHGYETAHDILFPKRNRRIKKFRSTRY
jgi:hypothetical protein